MSLIKLALKKEAGILDSALKLGTGLMENPTFRNAAIGAGAGALTGAVTAKSGEGLSGALKGATIGGLAGGAGTFAKNTIQAANKMGISQKAIAAAKGTTELPSYGTNLLNALSQQSSKLYHQGKNIINA